MPTRTVEKCKYSTIIEAWVVLKGVPGEVNEKEPAVLEYIANPKYIKDLLLMPAFVANDQSGEIANPYWKTQFSWAEGRHKVRVGHRYLSVHFIRKHQKYENFESSLKPQIAKWLDIYREYLANSQRIENVGEISFGYKNFFGFPVDNFDLSEYFKTGFKTGVDAAKKGLSSLNVNFSVPDPNTRFSLMVNPDEGNQANSVALYTTVETFQSLADLGVSFSDVEKVFDSIVDAKDVAKKNFFDFATEKTHMMMGAEYFDD